MNRPHYLIGLMILGLAGGCSLKEPGSPSWQVDLTVPIADRVYSLQDILSASMGDSVGNWADSVQNIPYLNFADSLDPDYVENELEFDALQEEIPAFIGLLTISTPSSRQTEFLVTSLAPQLPIGQSQPVPAFSFDSSPQPLTPFNEFDWAYLQSGQVLLTITNNLPVVVSGLTLYLYNSLPPGIYQQWDVSGSLAPDQTVSVTEALPSGALLDNSLSIRISGSSPGSSSPVVLEANDALTVSLELSSLAAISGRAHIVEQTVSLDTSFAIIETDSLRRAIIKSGSLSCTIHNQSNLYDTVSFSLPDFTLDGVAFNLQMPVGPGGSFQVAEYSLAGYQLERPQQDNLIHAIMQSKIVDTSDPRYGSWDGMATFEATDLILANFTISGLLFSYYEGVLDTSHQIPVDQDMQVLEGIPGGLETLAVESALADVRLNNTIGFPIVVYLSLMVYKGGALMMIHDLPPLPVEPGTPTEPGRLDTTIAGLESVVNALPDSILPTGRTVISGNGSAYDDQHFSGYYHIYAPFFFTMDESTLEPAPSTFEQGFESEIAIAELLMDLENHMPLSGEALILATFDSMQFGLPEGNVDTLMRAPLPPAQLDANHFASAPGFANVADEVDSAELAMFSASSEEHPLYLQTFIIIHSTGGDTVRCHSSDYIKVGAAAHLRLDIDTGD